MYNNVKVKAWIRSATKNHLIVDMENKLVSDGYAVLPLNDYMIAFLKTLGIEETFHARDGRVCGPQSLANIIKINERDAVALVNPGVLYEGLVLSRIYLTSKGDHIYVNAKYQDLIKDKKDLEVKGSNGVDPVRYYKDDELLVFALPIRMDSKIKVIYG